MVQEALPAKPLGRRGSETIFLVEDENAVRDLVQRGLEFYGYTVISVGTAHAALEIWPEVRDRIDMMVTDLVMPGGMNGRELALRLREDRPDLKVLYISGLACDSFGDIDLGDEPFLLKPFDVNQLAQRVRELVD